jgi:hypothetical protein
MDAQVFRQQLVRRSGSHLWKPSSQPRYHRYLLFAGNSRLCFRVLYLQRGYAFRIKVFFFCVRLFCYPHHHPPSWPLPRLFSLRLLQLRLDQPRDAYGLPLRRHERRGSGGPLVSSVEHLLGALCGLCAQEPTLHRGRADQGEQLSQRSGPFCTRASWLPVSG